MAAAALVLAGLTLAVALIGVSQLGGRVVVISGRSMEPAIPLGSVVVAAPLGAEQPRIGEVVTFAADNGQLVTHRIRRVLSVAGAEYVQTKGDANRAPDPALVPRSRLIGDVVVSAPSMGYVIVAMARPQGWAAFLATLALLWLAATWLREIVTPSVAPRPAFEDVPSP